MLAWDARALLWINGHQNPALDAVLYAVSVIGERGLLLALILAGALAWPLRGRWAEGALIGAAVLLADRLLFEGITVAFFRERPFLALEGVRQVGPLWYTSSFPSGHAHYVWFVTVVWGARRRSLLWLLVPFSLLTCYARPYFGMHYPLDVLAGSLLGFAAGAALLGVRRAWAGRDAAPARARGPSVREAPAAKGEQGGSWRGTS